MVIESEIRGDLCILRLKGRFATRADSSYLREKADEVKTTGCKKVLADFTGVPYIDSTGIGFVVGVYTSFVRAAGGQFVLCGLNRRVAHVLEITRLNTILQIFPDEKAALAALTDTETLKKQARG